MQVYVGVCVCECVCVGGGGGGGGGGAGRCVWTEDLIPVAKTCFCFSNACCNG